MTVQVVLETAYRWVCPRCKIINHAEAIPAELTPDERAEYAERLGCDGVELTAVPTFVTCYVCDSSYPVLQEELP